MISNLMRISAIDAVFRSSECASFFSGSTGMPIVKSAGNVESVVALYPIHAGVVARGLKSSLWAPIEYEGRTAGVLILLSERPDTYSEADIPLIMPIASELGRALGGELVPSMTSDSADWLARFASGLGEIMERIAQIEQKIDAQSADDAELPERRLYTAGGLSMDHPARRATVAGAALNLSPLEYQLLLELVRHRDEVVENERLMREVWGGAYGVDRHRIAVYIGRLRTKLREHPEAGARIDTVRGVGYRLSETAQGTLA